MFAVGICSFTLLEKYISSTLLDMSEKELIRAASSVVETIHSFEAIPTINQLNKLTERVSQVWGFRVTIIAKNGSVIGDSTLTVGAVRAIDNHGLRPEVVTARKTGLGISRRFSSTVGEELLYIAVLDDHKLTYSLLPKHSSTVHDGISDYIVRVSIPISSIQKNILELDLIFLLVGIFSLGATALLSYLGSCILVNRIKEGHDALENRVLARTKDISLLQTLSSSLNACLSLEEAKDVTLQIIPILLPNITGAIAIYKSSRNKLEIVVNWGGEWPGDTIFSPEDCWGLRKGKRHYSNHNDIRIRCPHLGDLGDRSSMCIPLLAQGEALGVLHLSSAKAEFINLDDQLATAIAEHVGLAIANLQLRDDLRQQAVRDALTGLYNRRYLSESLDQTIGQAKRRKSTLAVCMIDLDNFKKFNDDFGHESGDFVLKNVADVFKSCTRAGDFACRYGGEEFCLVLVDITENNAKDLVEKIRNQVRKLNLKFNDSSLGKVTISAGISFYPHNSSSGTELIRIADGFLYQAKKEGRDKVIM